MSDFKGRHFTADIILLAVRWYCKYGISYRVLAEMMLERGVTVNHTTLYCSGLAFPDSKLVWFSAIAGGTPLLCL